MIVFRVVDSSTMVLIQNALGKAVRNTDLFCTCGTLIEMARYFSQFWFINGREETHGKYTPSILQKGSNDFSVLRTTGLRLNGNRIL